MNDDALSTKLLMGFNPRNNDDEDVVLLLFLPVMSPLHFCSTSILYFSRRNESVSLSNALDANARRVSSPVNGLAALALLLEENPRVTANKAAARAAMMTPFDFGNGERALMVFNLSHRGPRPMKTGAGAVDAAKWQQADSAVSYFTGDSQKIRAAAAASCGVAPVHQAITKRRALKV